VARLLDQAARRGKLPGFRPTDSTSRFVLTDFGHPFAGILEAQHDGNGTIRFESRLRPGLPLLFAAILVATVWPGIWLTDSMLRMYFSWYDIPTWWWYLPLTVPFVPLGMLAALRRSRASIAREAEGLIRKVAAEVGGTVEGVSAAC
jgi:hypothetical protein